MATKDNIKVLDNNDKENLLLRTPYALPDNPSTKGFSASQIKAKMYEGHLLTFEWIKNLEEEICNILDEIDIGSVVVKRSEISEYAEKDLSGNIITATYETKEDSDEKYAELEEEISDVRDNGLQVSDIVDNLGSSASNKVLSAKQGSVLNNLIIGLQSDLSEKVSAEYVDQKVSEEENARELAIQGLENSKVNISDIENNLTSTSTNKPLSAFQGKVLKGLIDAIQEVLDSDDETLDQMSEIVAYIKNNKSLIESITTTKVNISDIIDNLTSEISNKPLSAKQGKVLKDLYDELSLSFDELEGDVDEHIDNTTIHVTSEDKIAWNNKQDQITSSSKLSATLISGLADVATSGDYDDLEGTPNIPTKLSELSNDEDFVTNETAQIGISQVTGLENALSNRAEDTNVVHKTAGAETIISNSTQGYKTFDNGIRLGDPTSSGSGTITVDKNNGALSLLSNGQGIGITFENRSIRPNVGSTVSLGLISYKYENLFLNGKIIKGTSDDQIEISTPSESGTIALTSDIPTNVSELNNDSGYLTSDDLSGKEDNSNKVITLSSSSTNNQYPSAKCVYDSLSAKENTSNKVTSLSSSSTDTQYPSAKAVYEEIEDVREIAQGKTKTFVIESQSDITGTKQSDGSFTNVTAIVGITLSELLIGDTILITDVAVPDLWVSQVSPSVTLSLLETVKVPITSISVNDVDIEPVNGEVNITVPTKTSDLTNDSGFLTSHQDISGKLDKVTATTSGTQIYGKLANGNQQMLDVSSSATADTIAIRGTNGVLNVGTPTSNSHATTKQYVDGALSSKQNVINGSNKLSASYVSGLSTVATSGLYSDLSGIPTIEEIGYED